MWIRNSVCNNVDMILSYSNDCCWGIVSDGLRTDSKRYMEREEAQKIIAAIERSTTKILLMNIAATWV